MYCYFTYYFNISSCIKNVQKYKKCSSVSKKMFFIFEKNVRILKEVFGNLKTEIEDVHDFLNSLPIKDVHKLNIISSI